MTKIYILLEDSLNSNSGILIFYTSNAFFIC